MNYFSPMVIDEKDYQALYAQIKAGGAELVAVSKTKPAEEIQQLYGYGHRDFGENYVQELAEKAATLPGDVRWHFIGHLQTNKVKLIAPFVHLIHGVDSSRLLREVDKQARKLGRVIPVLLQVHIASEETKFGMNEEELAECISVELPALHAVSFRGLMGMASFTENEQQVRDEFRKLRRLYDQYRQAPAGSSMNILSMGMSGDYRLALDEGSTMVRIGSLLFGARHYR